jgi:magnesium-transporting ATPase (P-type)
MATFFAYLFLTVLITVHGAIKPVGERGLWFYVPKLILIGVMWAFVIAVITYIRVKEKDDPSFAIHVSGFSAYQVLGIILVIAAILYALALAYYLFRAVGYFMKLRTVPNQFRSRALAVWLLTLTTVIGTVVNVALYLFRKKWNNAAQFLSYYVLYNMYAFTLAVFYFPSFTEKKSGTDDEDRLHIVDEENELEIME